MIRNPKYTEFGSIDVEVKVGDEWVPFTASLNDPEKTGRDFYAEALEMGPEEYVAPPPPPEPTPEEILAQERAQQTRDLNKAEFNRLLRLSGLDDAWDAVAAHLKANDRVAYADMMGELDKQTFRLDYTLGQIKVMDPIIRASGSRVTAEQVKEIWADVATGKG